MISSTRVAASLLRLRQRATTTTTTTTTTATANYVPSSSSSRRALSSSSSSPLAGDAGRKATHIHHRITTLLSLSVPAYLLVPPSYADSYLDKFLGVAIGGSIAGHSWIGMNYVATDYVPKVSRALVGPARVFNAALGIATFVGLGMIAVNDRGGIRGAVRGLWRPRVTPSTAVEVVGEGSK
jgi:hypothetical protein